MRKITLTTAECVYIVMNYNRNKADFNCMKTWDKWKLNKIIKAIQPIADEFTEFKTEQEIALTTEYSSDDKSHVVIKVVDGEEVRSRKIKGEFIEEYQNAQKNLNKELSEVASKKNEIEIEELSSEDIFKSVKDDAFTQESIEILSYITE